MKNIKTINCEDFYLEYVNNYLTVDKMAEDYNISKEEAMILIDEGRSINNSRDELTNE